MKPATPGSLFKPVTSGHAALAMYIGEALEDRSCWFAGEATFTKAKDDTDSLVAHVDRSECFPTHALRIFGKLQAANGVLEHIVVVQVEPHGVLRIFINREWSLGEVVQVDLRGAFFFPLVLVATVPPGSCRPR